MSNLFEVTALVTAQDQVECRIWICDYCGTWHGKVLSNCPKCGAPIPEEFIRAYLNQPFFYKRVSDIAELHKAIEASMYTCDAEFFAREGVEKITRITK